MVISNKDAIFNDDASWTKTNVCLVTTQHPMGISNRLTVVLQQELH